MTTPAAWSVVERAARDAYGRLLSALAYRFRDIAAAEDALGDALGAALERWPETGVPRSPEAWLMAVAKNRLRHVARHRAVVSDPRTSAALEELSIGLEQATETTTDSRLNLMFVCAHPAIDASLRTPLMLQTVLGLDALRIGRAFLVPGPTMGQRLVRAKQKIRDAGVPFDTPEGVDLSERLGAVLEGVYAAFGSAWDDTAGGQDAPDTAQALPEPLAEEALFLAQLLAQQLPNEPEVLGLLSLMTFSHARRSARVDADGAFVPLPLHDISRWDRSAILDADALLLRAASFRRPGPFQLEAAIQSAHCQRAFSDRTPWSAIAALYDFLNRTWPTIGSQVAHAAVLTELRQLEAAAALLATLDAARVASYAPYWVVVAQLASVQGAVETHSSALERAISLTASPRLRLYLQQRLAAGVQG